MYCYCTYQNVFLCLRTYEIAAVVFVYIALINEYLKMGMELFNMYAQLYESERRFQKACDQIAFLNG